MQKVVGSNPISRFVRFGSMEPVLVFHRLCWHLSGLVGPGPLSVPIRQRGPQPCRWPPRTAVADGILAAWRKRRPSTTATKGVEPVDDLIESLPAKPAAKIDAYVEQYLNGRPPDAPPPDFPITSQIDGELRELRVRFANTRYRVLYQRSDNLVVLLHAFEKHTGAVPHADKRLAQKRMDDFKTRMDAQRRLRPRAAGKDAPPRSRRSD
jgi:phage-related protein